MAQTFRKDPEDVAKKKGDHIYMGTVLARDEPQWKLHRDKKKSHKPSVRAKKYLHKGRRNKLRIDPRQDFDNIPVPVERKSDVWNYN